MSRQRLRSSDADRLPRLILSSTSEGSTSGARTSSARTSPWRTSTARTCPTPSCPTQTSPARTSPMRTSHGPSSRGRISSRRTFSEPTSPERASAAQTSPRRFSTTPNSPGLGSTTPNSSARTSSGRTSRGPTSRERACRERTCPKRTCPERTSWPRTCRVPTSARQRLIGQQDGQADSIGIAPGSTSSPSGRMVGPASSRPDVQTASRPPTSLHTAHVQQLAALRATGGRAADRLGQVRQPSRRFQWPAGRSRVGRQGALGRWQGVVAAVGASVVTIDACQWTRRFGIKRPQGIGDELTNDTPKIRSMSSIDTK
jgi:hypothetical protein